MKFLVSAQRIIPGLVKIISRRNKGLRSLHLAGTLQWGKANRAKEDAVSIKDVKPFEQIPGPDVTSPYLGALPEYTEGSLGRNTFHDAITSCFKQYGKIYKENMTGSTIVHLADADDVLKMYQTEGKMPQSVSFFKPTEAYRKNRTLSPGLGTSNGEIWSRLRFPMQKAILHPQAVANFVPTMDVVASDFVKRLKSIKEPTTGEIPNLENEICKSNLESAGMYCAEKRLGSFNAEPGSPPQNIIDLNHRIVETTFQLYFTPAVDPENPTALWEKLVEDEDSLYSYTKHLVEETLCRIQALSQTGELKENQYYFLRTLAADPHLNKKDVTILAHSMFTDAIITVTKPFSKCSLQRFFIDIELTSGTMASLLYVLAVNPDKQHKLYEEIRQIAPNKDEPLTAEMMRSARYLKASIREGMRLFPIATEVTRVTERDLILSGYHVPAGTQLENNMNVLMNDAIYFDNPGSFIPERWLPGGSEEKPHPCLKIPFSAGLRGCVGRRYAQQEMEVIILKLLQHFRLEWPHKEEMNQIFRVLLRPDIPARVKFTDRQ